MYKIALVVDENFGEHLIDVARDAYVWVVESAVNDPYTKQLWREPHSSEDPLLNGVSSFTRYTNETMIEMTTRLLELIDEHHGEYAHDPEWSEIEVWGASLSREVAEAAQTYGVDKIETTSESFRLIRSANSSCPPGIP